MSSVKVAIVEDDLLIAEDIRVKLKKSGYDIISMVESGEEILHDLRINPVPDLIIMDIHLAGDIDGIQTVERINKEYTLGVIYLTDDHQSETIKRAALTRPISYIVKPFNEHQLHAAIELAFSNASYIKSRPNELGDSPYRLENAIFIKDKTRFIRLEINDIIRLQGDRMYTDIISKERKYKVTGPISKVSGSFFDPFFMRVHRSHVVNINHIRQFEGNMLYFEKGEVQVGKKYREEVFKKLRVL